MIDILDTRGNFLHGKWNRVNSQNGEDGIIAAIFARIGINNAWCWEVGAADGERLSNTKCLRDAGWRAVLIEADDEQFEKLLRYESPLVQCFKRRIVPGTLDNIFAEAGVPARADLGIIDIDGQDYHILDRLNRLPRVLVIECADGVDSEVPPLGATHGQAGQTAICELAKSRGYVPLVKTGVNVVCVLEDEISCPYCRKVDNA